MFVTFDMIRTLRRAGNIVSYERTVAVDGGQVSIYKFGDQDLLVHLAEVKQHELGMVRLTSLP